MLYLYIGLGVAGLLLVGFLVSVLVVSGICYKRFFYRGKEDKVSQLTDKHYDPFRQQIFDAKAEVEQLPYEELTCTASDGIELYAKYFNLRSDKTVICIHGLRSCPLNNYAVDILRFRAEGFNVLLPDLRAHGKSGGEITTYGQLESDDIIRWIKLVKAQSNCKVVLYGISMGAICVGYALDRIDNTDVSVAVYNCGFPCVGTMIETLTRRNHAPRAVGKIIKSRCKRELGIDLEETIEDNLSRTTIPSIFVHGLEDNSIPAEESRKCFDACAAPKELIMVEGCGHTTAALRGDAPNKIMEFIKKYL